MRYGYFDDQNREYVIDRPDVPVSWTNYLGVKDLCTVLSHNAGGYSFFRTAEHHRITRFRQNGVPLDRPGHYVYLRDDDVDDRRGVDYWSLSWQPVGRDLDQARYECRHGLSYSRFVCDYRDIEAEQILFIPIADDVELWDVRIRNRGERTRRISVFSYVEFSFHHIEIDNQNLQMSLYASGSSYQDGILEYDFFYEPRTYHFFAANFEPDSYDGVRDRFLGSSRTESNPLAVERGACHGSTELGGNHCGALHKRLTLHPGDEARLIFMLGVGPRDPQGYAIREKYSELDQVDRAFADLRTYWQEKLSVLQISTPDKGMNTTINTWNLYQAGTCVVWSRFASFVEVGGRTGLGYRDTSQDVMSVVHTHPEKCRQRILELLHGQVRQGYGLHLFDPEVFKAQEERLPGVRLPTVVPTPRPEDIVHGLEDVCADDVLWLVVTICEFVKETGDLAFFDQSVPFADSGEASVYEHLQRALDFSAEQVGSHGICRGLRADWNDCLNLGGGESAMVSFMHHWALQAFLEAAEFLGRTGDVERYRTLAERVKETCEAELWDGSWYIRGITAKGRRIGARDSLEGKIFLNAQSWAVLSGVAAQDRASRCMDAVGEYLSSPYGLHLLWPAFSAPDDDIGYVARVYKGIKENGSIFSHTNPWAIIAECKLGRGDRAFQFYEAMLPYNQNDLVEVRQAEPYTYCQFVMGRDHTAFGRARHPWLTGSAGWFYTAATRWILGIRLTFDGLIVDPCIPGDWAGFEAVRRWRGATFHITVRNPFHVQKGVRTITLDGQPVEGSIPPQVPGSVHQVNVVMG
jgi:N,N'-diacetylchitobiose phosphorylase